MPLSRPYRYRVVDVVAEEPLEGNPLAVFPDASGLDDVTMQKIARELNLSETAFVLPPTLADCAAQVRIFTPAKEMIFAGHPTVGTCFVLLDEGIIHREADRFLVQEKVGPIPVRVQHGDRPMIWLTTPSIGEGRTFDSGQCAAALGLDAADLLSIKPQLLSAGNPTLLVPVKTKAVVDRAFVDSAGMALLKAPGDEPFCVFVFTPVPGGAYSRMFAPAYGVAEDPATGSSTGPLASFMLRHGLLSESANHRWTSEQGTKMGRRSTLHIEVLSEAGCQRIDVGGHATPLVEAVMQL